MKQYYKVSFEYSPNVFCANIAHAETLADVEREYSRYNWSNIRPAHPWELEEARVKGMPVIEVEHIDEPTEPTAEQATPAHTVHINVWGIATHYDADGNICGREETTPDSPAWYRTQGFGVTDDCYQSTDTDTDAPDPDAHTDNNEEDNNMTTMYKTDGITRAAAKYLTKHIDDLLSRRAKITYHNMVYWASPYTMEVYAHTDLDEIGGSITGYKVANITDDWQIVSI